MNAVTQSHTHTYAHTRTHTHAHTDTSPDYGVHPPLFEFDSHQSLLCLLCYVLLVHLL